MSWKEMRVGELEKIELPLSDLLAESVYYPCAALDGDPVRIMSGGYSSFVYVDYAIEEKRFLSEVIQRPFKGYDLVLLRKLRAEELGLRCWSDVIPEFLYEHHASQWLANPYGYWAVFDAISPFCHAEQVNRISMLYLRGEGAEVYERLYRQQKCSADVVCLIQSGAGFGGNYEAFESPDSRFARIVMSGSMPTYVLHGGIGSKRLYEVPCWPAYSGFVSIHDKLSDHGCVGSISVWDRNDEFDI